MWQPRKRVGRAALPISELSRLMSRVWSVRTARPRDVLQCVRLTLTLFVPLYTACLQPIVAHPRFHTIPFPFPSRAPLLVAPQSLRPKTRRSPIPRWPTSQARPPRKDPAPRSTRRPRPTASLLGKGFTIYRLIQTTFRMFLYLLLP